MILEFLDTITYCLLTIVKDAYREQKRTHADPDIPPQLILCFEVFGTQCSHFKHLRKFSIRFRGPEPFDFLLPGLRCTVALS